MGKIVVFRTKEERDSATRVIAFTAKRQVQQREAQEEVNRCERHFVASVNQGRPADMKLAEACNLIEALKKQVALYK